MDSIESSFLFLVHPFGANYYNDMPSIRDAFEKYNGHCQAVHQGRYEDGKSFRIIMASK